MNQVAYFAAGCFWGVQHYFDQVPGVIKTEVGYTGGYVDRPYYDLVCTHTTGHAEAVKIIFNTGMISYETLVKHFMRIHDPTQLNRQGPDIGNSYRSAVFYTTKKQKLTAQKVVDKLNKVEFNGKVVSSIEKFKKWWPAEAFHQKFTERTSRGMCHVSYKPVN